MVAVFLWVGINDFSGSGVYYYLWMADNTPGAEQASFLIL